MNHVSRSCRRAVHAHVGVAHIAARSLVAIVIHSGTQQVVQISRSRRDSCGQPRPGREADEVRAYRTRLTALMPVHVLLC